MSFDGVLALRYISGVMNAGGSLDEALRALAEEAPEPLRRQAAARLSSRQFVSSVQERAEGLFPEREFRLARAALMLAHDAGGPAGALLERCARQMEDRRRWLQRRRALSAQTVMSAWIVGSMPAFLVLVLALTAPDYLEPLIHSAAGHACLLVASLLTLAGVWMVRRMVSDND